MANFAAAVMGLRIAEGGYSNDPADRGGETVAGISRVHWPSWPGWAVMDEIVARDAPALPLLRADDFARLEPHITEFYRAKFWAPINGDRLVSQEIAEECFEASVNVGYVARKWLQRALNVCNARQTHWPDLLVDGVIGEATISCVAAAVARRQAPRVLAVQNILQGSHYVTLMEQREADERWIGWLGRTGFVLLAGAA
jgi:lysozyme family protein